jgi:hypothetical protein
MSIADVLEKRIRQHRPIDLPVAWADEIIFPYYDGLTLRNVPHTVAQLLEVEANGLGSTPLDEAIWGGKALQLRSNIQRVVVILSDGLGYLRLKQAIEHDESGELRETVAELTDGRGPLPLSSSAPSTTCTALPTLWTGRGPISHGMIATRLYLREVGALSHLLHYRPAASNQKESLLGWGLQPETFIPGQTVGEILAEAGVPTHVVVTDGIQGSALSRTIYRGVGQTVVHAGYNDTWPTVQNVLATTAGQRCYVHVYWEAVDTLSHLHGAGHDWLMYEIKRQLAEIKNVLNSEAVQDGQTLVMILADHGHHDVSETIAVHQHPQAAPIWDAMRGPMGGEVRLGYLYLRDGYKQQVIETIERHFQDCLTWIEPEAAIQSGMFGPLDFDTPYVEAIHRLGDLILVPRLRYRLGDYLRQLTARSLHGGLSEWEMLVPLLWRVI